MIASVCAVEAAWPVPDVNEAHYVGRCRRFWDPSFCPGDFFFSTADGHAAFFATCGWITRWCDLPTAAWLGRLATWLLVGVSWTRLSRAVLQADWTLAWACLTAAAMMALNHRAHEAGEWMIGGFEGKGLAFAAVFAALADAQEKRWNRAGLIFGLATALHPLVGGWAGLATAFAALTSGSWAASSPGSWRAVLPGLAGGGLIALAGVWPALQLNAGIGPDISGEAARLYVYQRLPHHLWPLSFKTELVRSFALLVTGWIVVAALARRDESTKLLRRYVLFALLVAGAGWGIAWAAPDQPLWAARWLRYYWFRLADAAVPLGAALVGGRLLARGWNTKLSWSKPAGAVVLAGVLAHFGLLVQERITLGVPRADGANKVLDPRSWRQACEWIEQHTPAEAVFLTPRNSVTFKWYARRGEVVSWKDVPQDARSLVEWWRRMHLVHGTGAKPPEKIFYDSLAETSAAHLREIAEYYQATYVLTSREPSLDLPRVYDNAHYAVYQFTPAAADSRR